MLYLFESYLRCTLKFQMLLIRNEIHISFAWSTPLSRSLDTVNRAW